MKKTLFQHIIFLYINGKIFLVNKYINLIKSDTDLYFTSHTKIN